jgi:hypothetical protein
MDTVVELYDPDNTLIANVDSTFAGGTEEMLGIAILDDGEYTIVVRDFFNDGGNYEISVTEGTADEGGAGTPGNQVFIFADDDGQPLGDGFTSAEIFTELMAADFDVTTWTASADGPIPDNTLQDFDLVIWDSGTYRDEDGLFGNDTATIFDYIDAGGDILISGASPTILGSIDLAPLDAVAIVADDPILSDGFTEGEVVELDAEYETAMTEAADVGDNEALFLIRGPEADGAGAAVGLAAIDANLAGQKTVFLLVPFGALSADAREQLLSNIIAWFAG